ncbi:MAG: glycosyltransferase [Vicinamibacteria bacterium]|nr:glycosyltransferase [Vicinamibacteria bacterium]
MSDAAPRVSVIIPAYYSHGTVRLCLEALGRQTFCDFETIVVNSSPDTTTADLVISEFPEVRFVQSPDRLLPHAARNLGVGLASGALLVFTDPDCEAAPDWLEWLVAANDAGHRVVGGSIEPGSRRWLECGTHLCKFSWVLSGLAPGPRWILPSANVSYARGVWDAVGPLDPTRFCSDSLLSWKAAASGDRPWFEPRAVVKHHHDDAFGAYWRERLGRGREFGAMRIEFERWSRGRAAARLPLLPLLVPLVLARAARDAVRSGWGMRFVTTLPVQLAGQLAWCLGEARSCWRHATSGDAIGERSTV